MHNSSYKTVLLNFKDNDVQFKYVEYQPLEFNETTTPTNLTGLLAFYAYFILGLDYDSFSMDGGGSYYAKAEAIAIALDAVLNGTIIIDSEEYLINNVSRTTQIISLGIEKGTKGRRLFVVNFLMTMKRII